MRLAQSLSPDRGLKLIHDVSILGALIVPARVHPNGAADLHVGERCVIGGGTRGVRIVKVQLDLDGGVLTLTREDGTSASYRRFAVTGEPGGLQQIDTPPPDPSLFMTPLAHL